MVRRARRVLGSEDLAWDAVQEALLALWQAPGHPPEPGRWLARTLVHRCLHIRRTLHRRWTYEAQAGRATAEIRRISDDPATELERAQVQQALGAAVGLLPLGQRHAFVLREVEGLGYQDIACRLGVPIGTVRSRLARARQTLQQALHDVGR